MIEKVNMKHPDKIADRIAGAIVDLAYTKEVNPKIAVEVMIGHGECYIVIESSCDTEREEIIDIVSRIHKKPIRTVIRAFDQDKHLARNQSEEIKCGDNGIFKGIPITAEQNKLSSIARNLYFRYNADGKYILNKDKLIICQSNANTEDIKVDYPKAIINPLGDWTGGTDVDTGCTNRKLGSDMADGVTGGGLHGKDLSKADVSVNIYAFLKAQRTKKPVELFCAIGDTHIDGKPYSEIVKEAKEFITRLGGFERLAEWGLF